MNTIDPRRPASVKDFLLLTSMGIGAILLAYLVTRLMQ
jgi:hypothetical protein